MANVKINDLALAGGVSNTMQLETDIGGATENKITVAQLSDKILNTDLGLTTTVANAVQTTNATTDGLAESDVVLTAPAANQLQLTNGTTDLLVTADCTIDQDVATTADVTFNSVNLVNAIDEFSTDGTMAGNSDSAVPTEKAIVTYVTAQIAADQDNIYYVKTNGNDSDSGLNIENAFLTIQKGADTADLQTPTATNRYVVRVHDGGTYGVFSLASKPYINIEADGAQLSSASTYFTIGNENTLSVNRITSEGAFSGNLVYCSLAGGSDQCFLRANEIDSSVAVKALNMVGPGNVYATVEKINVPTSSIAVSVNLDITLYLYSKFISGKIEINEDCYAHIETNILAGDITLGLNATLTIIINGNFSWDVTVGENAKLNLIVNGIYDGDITTATGSIVNIKLGSRTGGFTDSIHSGSTTSILIASTGESNINSNLTLPATILDAQGSAPSTTDGTIYYNSSSNDFQFRENGSWITIGTTNVWQRVGTTISPVTANDDLDMGTGDIDAANVDVTGNYQIGSARVLAIDPGLRSQLFVGYQAGLNTEIDGDAYRNTAVGHEALKTNVKGDYNTAVGFSSLSLNANDEDGLNTAIGAYSLWQSTGTRNTANGAYAGYYQGAGNSNILIGAYAGSGTGAHSKSNNVMIGYNAGGSCEGTGNILLGYHAGANETGSNKLYIQNSNSATPLIYGEFDNDQVIINGGLTINGDSYLKRTASAVDYNPSALTSDNIISITDTSIARAVTISTEDVQSGSTANPRIMIIKDESGNAGTNNITVSLESGNIDGAANYVIDTDNGSVILYLDGTNGFTYANNEAGGVSAIWQRVATTISPVTAGDDLDLGTGTITTTGEIVGGDLTITGSTPQLKFNDTDDDVYIITTEGDDDIHFYNNVAGENAYYKFFTSDGDGTDHISLQIFATGTTASTSNNEAMKIEYRYDYDLFQIISSSSGTGVRKDLRFSADSAGGSNQLLLDTSGNVSMSGELSVSEKIGAAVSTLLYPLQANASSSTLGVPLLIDNETGGATSATGIRFRASSGESTDIRCKAAIFFERTGSGGVGSLHLAVEGTNDDSNVDLTDAKLTVDSAGDVSMSGSLTVTGAVTLQVDTTDVSNPPTDAQLDTAFGTPATVGAGWTTYLDDNGAGNNFYQVVSDGSNWWISTFTKAV